ncbi:hypothetical protein FO519_004807 [Halicephalobus sp. NKZ332]|nr:hypothetical protein FO519_004807 [Halicephalobus sp. NKZ332]
MDVAFDLSKVFENSPIERLDQARLKWITPRKNFEIVKAIDRCGEASAQFQKLRKPVTTYDRILDSPDHHRIPVRHQQDIAGDIIHGRIQEPERKEPGPETPRGRKNTRDFGHSNIFG